MCKIDSEIHFCTCKDDKNIKIFNENTSVKTFILWSLHTYIGTYNSGLDGILMPPQSMLNIGLKSDFILEKLNREKKIFDFDYTPSKGDNLIIKEFSIKGKITPIKLKKRFKRNDYNSQMSFIFRDHEWEEDYYDSFIIKTKQFKQGTLNKK